MTDNGRDLCGESTENTDSCENYADTCPWHSDGEKPDTGRTPKLLKDPEIADVIVAARENGATKTEAAQRASVSKDTINRWQRRGEEQKDKPPDERDEFYDFYDRCADAEAEDKEWLRDRMRGNGEDDWRQQAWELERKYPEEYREKSKSELEHSGKIDGFNFVIDAHSDSNG